MFEKFTSANAQDFSQRYRGTYGYFTRKGTRILVRLTDVSGRSVFFMDKDGVEYTLNADSEDDSTGFTFIPPKCRYYNTRDNGPLLVRRIAAKQYARGISERNTAIEMISGYAMPVDFGALHMLYEQSIPFEQALDAMLKSRGSYRGVALSPQFAYWHGGCKLKCFNIDLGSAEYDKASNTLHVQLEAPDLWKQEVVDAIRRNNIKGDVK